VGKKRGKKKKLGCKGIRKIKRLGKEESGERIVRNDTSYQGRGIHAKKDGGEGSRKSPEGVIKKGVHLQREGINSACRVLELKLLMA